MKNLQIEGGFPITGTVTPMPNKNSVLKIIVASVLADDTVTLHNVPMSSSVRVMLKAFREIGGKVSYKDQNTIRLNPTTISSYTISKEVAQKERTSLLYFGALSAKFGKAEVGGAGGCKLGNRPIDTLYQGLMELGAKIDPENMYKLSTKGLIGKDIWQLEASVTATENLVIAALKAKGTTTIYNAACEPHTQDLCNFLNSLGAKIEGIGSNKLIITGVESLSGGEWTIIPDHVDIGGLIVAAAITNGELRIKNAIPQHMTQILNYYSKISLKYEIDGQDIIIPAKQKLECKRNMKGDIDKIPDQPWPGFPVDLIPQMVVLAAKASGTIKIMSNMYETQLNFVNEESNIMRTNVLLADTRTAFTFGPSDFKGANVNAPAILQSAHAVFLTALAARGTTVIRNADIIERRYPNIAGVYNKLGAKVKEI